MPPYFHNTSLFNYRDFKDVSWLRQLKEAAGVAVSVCIPTLNEESTLGDKITLLARLQHNLNIIDEVVVVDSGSVDRTCELAAHQGADVYHSGHILTPLGTRMGKGENLWKSLFVLKGDIIIWVDADILDFDHRFVLGLLGPLLTHPSIAYVKSYYTRPFGDADSGGGRMTELLTRPMLNLLFPEVRDIIQPMSGEFAVRRSFIDKIPFFTGSSVDVCHIVDMTHKFGKHTIAQVNLGSRRHRHHDLAELSKRCFGVCRSLLHRAESLGRISLIQPLDLMYHTFAVVNEKWTTIIEAPAEDERPPAITIDDYVKRKHNARLVFGPIMTAPEATPPRMQDREIQIAEFSALRDELLKRMSFQSRLTEIGILMFSAFLALCAWITGEAFVTPSNAVSVVFVLLAAPIMFGLLLWTYQEQNYFVSSIGRYLCHEIPIKEQLGWERFIGARRRFHHNVLTGSRFLFLTLFTLAPLVAAIHFVSEYSVHLSFAHWLLIIIDGTILLGAFMSRVRIED